MDSYLDLAKKVLLEARSPLSAREIMKAAYTLQIVPRDLYGQTQHKTLQARLSTDVLRQRGRSEFYRTGPGRFFLRCMQGEESAASRRWSEYIAPLRAAQLGRFNVLALPRRELVLLAAASDGRLAMADISAAPYCYLRLHDARRRHDFVVLRVLVLLVDDGRLLLRRGRKSEDGELVSGLSVAFEGFVRQGDRSLFSDDEFGLVDAAQRTLAEWLKLSPRALSRLERLRTFASAPVLFEQRNAPASDDLIAVVTFGCTRSPEIVDAARAAGADEWHLMPLRANDLDRFDRWSRRIIEDESLQISVTT